ncbi:sodium:solute symporter family transporter [Portibacter marinus]|uniref:sodium:solute symporter family transporter n=1 Tax=Portibacter marinus TaxID=2898660 RepID=UPI001EEAA564|nr:sodium/solute symporter [Portibacter marinus]
MELQNIQVVVFLGLTLLIAIVTFWFCRGARQGEDGTQEYFLAGNDLKWYFVAGSITLTNLSTDQLVGMNGNQMALLAWWELAAVAGLLMLTFIFLPIYYRYECTTTTELLEKRYNNQHIRAVISVLFLLGNIFIFLPGVLYGGSLFMQSMFGIDLNLYILAALFAIVGAIYAIVGGLRAVAVSDTFSGILLLGLAILVVFVSLRAINFDFSGIPQERLTLIGGPASDIPFSALFTGMIFIQMFYWSTNQTITQRAMASPTVKEAQKGVLFAALIRLLIVPPIIVLPGIVAFKLYGDIGDATYGTIVGDLLPSFLSGAFAAAIAAAVLTTFNSILNASAALWVCDIHKTYFNKNPNVKRLSLWVSIAMVLLAFMMIPIFNNPESSLINTMQTLFGLLSMPILSAFIVGLLFKNVNPYAMIIAVVFSVCLYAFFIFVWPSLPGGGYIHMMAVTLFAGIAMALTVNRLVFKQNAIWDANRIFAD